MLWILREKLWEFLINIKSFKVLVIFSYFFGVVVVFNILIIIVEIVFMVIELVRYVDI